MPAFLRKYQNLHRNTWLLIGAELLLQLINASFFLLFNFYMEEKGFPDHRIADFVSYRFLAVMLFAFPVGLLIKGRKVRPLFLIATIATPVISLAVIAFAHFGMEVWLYVSLCLWGVSFTCIQITALPYLLNNTPKEQHPEGIALLFLTFHLSIFITGGINFLLQKWLPEVFNPGVLITLFCGIGFFASICIGLMKGEEIVTERASIFRLDKNYDWGLIISALIPTFIIAVGAGFTIPFINLFFLNVHQVGPQYFSLMGSFSYFLVVIGVLFAPGFRRKFGYKISITLIQSLSIVALILLATTEYYKDLWIALPIAALFYIIRQPLMNVAAPMTSELTMYYVGKRNQELMSAINASIWSGSWFFSSQIFRILRENGTTYAGIFLITATLYCIGVLMYYFLILAYEKRMSKGIEEENQPVN